MHIYKIGLACLHMCNEIGQTLLHRGFTCLLLHSKLATKFINFYLLFVKLCLVGCQIFLLFNNALEQLIELCMRCFLLACCLLQPMYMFCCTILPNSLPYLVLLNDIVTPLLKIALYGFKHSYKGMFFWLVALLYMLQLRLLLACKRCANCCCCSCSRALAP